MARGRSTKAPLLPGRGPLAGVPPLVVFLLVIGVFTAGVLIKGAVGACLLLALAAGVGALLAATWGVLAPGQRIGRIAVLAMLVVIAVSVL